MLCITPYIYNLYDVCNITSTPFDQYFASIVISVHSYHDLDLESHCHSVLSICLTVCVQYQKQHHMTNKEMEIQVHMLRCLIFDLEFHGHFSLHVANYYAVLYIKIDNLPM